VSIFHSLVDGLLLVSSVFVLVGSIFLSFRLRFVQLRLFPKLFKGFFNSLKRNSDEEGEHTVLPHRALFASMSTTLGISTIVAPVIAIHVGGPGALIGFLLTAFFGSAATFVEVDLSVRYREKFKDGSISGGPMPYLRRHLSPKFASFYAIGAMMLMMAWSGAQANQLAAILSSPLLGSFTIPKVVSGIVIALLVTKALLGGIKWIGRFSAKLVPVMFTLYLGSSLWILAANYDRLFGVFAEILRCAIEPHAIVGGAAVGGLVSSLRWGIFKGMQATEAGIGMQAIPHSLSETEDATAQATLAMLSSYTAGFVAFVSGCVSMVTGTWADNSLPLGISMVAASFHQYFSTFGVVVVTVSTLLFGFGTILGNSFNGGQCFRYLAAGKKKSLFYIFTAVLIVVGAMADAKAFWSYIDICLAAIAVPHMAALVLSVKKERVPTLLATKMEA